MSRLWFKAVSDVGCRRAGNEDMALAAGKLVRDASWSGSLAFGSARTRTRPLPWPTAWGATRAGT